MFDKLNIEMFETWYFKWIKFYLTDEVIFISSPINSRFVSVR